MHVAVIIPVFNPDSRLERLVGALRSLHMERILVVDDASSATYAHQFVRLAHDYQCALCGHVSRLGSGESIRTGLREALTQWPDCVGYIVVDAWEQVKASEIWRIGEKLKEHQDSVLLAAAGAGKKKTLSQHLINVLIRVHTGNAQGDIRGGVCGLPASRLQLLARWGHKWLPEIPGLIVCAAVSGIPVRKVMLEETPDPMQEWCDCSLPERGLWMQERDVDFRRST